MKTLSFICYLETERSEKSLCCLTEKKNPEHESDILRLYWFQQCLTQVTVDNGVNMHIHVNINTCNNVYHVFINFKLRVFFSRSIR